MLLQFKKKTSGILETNLAIYILAQNACFVQIEDNFVIEPLSMDENNCSTRKYQNTSSTSSTLINSVKHSLLTLNTVILFITNILDMLKQLYISNKNLVIL